MEKNSSVHLSCSIVSYNSSLSDLSALLTSLVASIGEASDDGLLSKSEVYLIENGRFRTDLESCRRILSKSEISLNIIQGQGNVGYGTAHNLAIRKTKSHHHLVLNPDVVLAKRNIPAAIRFIKAHKDAVMLAPLAKYPDGRPQYLSKNSPSVTCLLIRGFGGKFFKKLFDRKLARYELRDAIQRGKPFTVPIASGCYMYCDRQVLVACKMFDEEYFLYFEDYDLCRRISEKGSIYHVPEIEIVHAGGDSAKKGFDHIRMFLRSGVRYFNQYGWKWL